MDNRKIKNANPNEYKGIKFKSSAETRIYKALISQGITPDYEAHTFILSPKQRATVPFYNRTKVRGFHFISEPISQITYTPDFTFNLNGVFVIIEVKGIENDVFPVKKNLFRKYLETLDYPVMFFEIRNKAELLESLKIVGMESKQIQMIRKLIQSLPMSDITIANRMLANRQLDELQDLVDSAITKVEKGRAKSHPRYLDIDLDNLITLSSIIDEYNGNNIP